VTGDIDETDSDLAQIEIGKSNIDRDAAALLFRQTISVDAGEGAHQRGLAVIDVSGRANNDRFHIEFVRR